MWEQLSPQCPEFIVQCKLLPDLLDLRQDGLEHVLVERPSCLRRLGNYFEVCCWETCLEPTCVEDLPPVDGEPVGELEHRLEGLDILEVFHNEIQTVRHAPDIVNGQRIVAAMTPYFPL